MLGISIVWEFFISWNLSLVSVGCIPVFWTTTAIFSHISSKLEDKCNKLSDETSDAFTETFSNIRVVRALTLKLYFEKKYGLSCQNLQDWIVPSYLLRIGLLTGRRNFFLDRGDPLLLRYGKSPPVGH